MKIRTVLSVMALISGQWFAPVHAGIADDMDAIMNANASVSASNVKHAKWLFETTGTSVKVYMFAKKSSHSTNTMNIKVGTGSTYAFSSTTSYGQSISIGSTPGQSVQISIRNSSGDVFPSDNWDSDGYGHFKVLNFPGFDTREGGTTMLVPPGIWLGMEDSRNHSGGAWYDYNDFCVVVVGCKAKFRVRVPTPPSVTTVTYDDKDQQSRLVNMVNGILIRKVEDQY